jgi:hypothetical protein
VRLDVQLRKSLVDKRKQLIVGDAKLFGDFVGAFWARDAALQFFQNTFFKLTANIVHHLVQIWPRDGVGVRLDLQLRILPVNNRYQLIVGNFEFLGDFIGSFAHSVLLGL